MIFRWQFNRQNTPQKTLDTVLRKNFKHNIFELFFKFFSSTQTFEDFFNKAANLLSIATVGGTPRLNCSRLSSKISTDTKSLSLMLNRPVKIKNK